MVSICLPTYNRPELLRRAIASCLSQTYPDFEIVVTDNSRDDESKIVAEGFKDPRLRYYKNETNIGGIANLDKGLRLARGKYIKMLMDDDLLKPHCLERQVEALENHPTAGVAMAPMELIDANDQRITPRFYIFRTMIYRFRYQVGDGLIDRKTIMREFLVHDYPCTVPSALLFRADAVRELGFLDPKAQFAVDLDLCMRMATKWDFYYHDEVLSSWRYLPDCHTAAQHVRGFPVEAFYYITRKALSNPETLKMFPESEHEKLRMDAEFFCTCRCLLNVLAAIRAPSWHLLWETLKIIHREDHYFWNKVRLPFWAAKQVWISLFPPQRPPARGG